MQTMTIFGRQSCGYCRRAKQLCESQGLEYRYVDIEEEGITQADLEKTVGGPVTTVPQIFHGKDYIGGYEALQRFLEEIRVSTSKPMSV